MFETLFDFFHLIEYDPNRSARIALIVYADGSKSYILAPNGLKVGQTVLSGEGVAPEVGNTLLLANIPLGTKQTFSGSFVLS